MCIVSCILVILGLGNIGASVLGVEQLPDRVGAGVCCGIRSMEGNADERLFAILCGVLIAYASCLQELKLSYFCEGS